jgi:hypothetical protein
MDNIKKIIYYWGLKLFPKYLMKHLYKINTGLFLDYNNIRTYNEKLQIIKLNSVKLHLDYFADKYKIREYIVAHNLERILPKLYGVYNNFNEINFNQLPNKFVLKLTHGWSYNVIVVNKDNINLNVLKKQINEWKKSKFGYFTGELHYLKIKPKIICEEYLEDSNGELKDYKILCFNGEPQIIQVDSNRFFEHRRDFFDTTWKSVDIQYGYEKNETIIPPPLNLSEMLKIAKKLSEGFAHVRVDLYSVNGKTYFGELTFTPTGGYKEFEPIEYNLELGKLIKL